MKIVILPKPLRFLLPKWVTAITLWPFVVFRNSSGLENPIIINHEKIHLKQQLELFVVLFYVLYVMEFLYHLIVTQNSRLAYRKISFEREAYRNDSNLEYLNSRKCYAMWR